MYSKKRIFSLSILPALAFFLSDLTFGDSTNPNELPACIKDSSELTKIKNSLSSANTSQRYKGYLHALSSASNTELFARLAYAETLAANCTDLNKEISARIVHVIGNRVLIRKGDVRSVVFQNAQFASSLHIYKNSRYLDFLCPKDLELWSFITTQVDTFLKKKSGGLSADTVHYFLYKHEPRWKKEPWKLTEDTSGATEKLRQCLRTFRNPNWK